MSRMSDGGFVMESDIQYRELSPQTLESKVFLTADDVNELC